ncbi:uncharacterized protein LOC110635989 isoform X2 [Hevea brasiliensis]|uniref:uncharacterized protein LOC110635989 isoform X2 n=1 Tax=Hevea brasiliensis TaxID=3981 RepID=UPI0025D5EB5F|nr:uncharacterized protein LOC110635989 isoform X2 [Hevea brasiliensis]
MSESHSATCMSSVTSTHALAFSPGSDQSVNDSHLCRFDSLHLGNKSQLPVASLAPGIKRMDFDVTICQNCGDRGFSKALIFCHECQAYAVHWIVIQRSQNYPVGDTVQDKAAKRARRNAQG